MLLGVPRSLLQPEDALSFKGEGEDRPSFAFPPTHVMTNARLLTVDTIQSFQSRLAVHILSIDSGVLKVTGGSLKKQQLSSLTSCRNKK